MGIFTRMTAAMADGVGAAVSGLRGLLPGTGSDPESRAVAFTIAVIALSAKMAKADGVVSRSEVDAFCSIFEIPEGEETNVARVYNLAKRDIAGFESYASDVRRILDDDREMLEAVLDGLFDIAKADGAVHERELAYLTRVGSCSASPPMPLPASARATSLRTASTPISYSTRSATGILSACAASIAGLSPRTIPTA